MGRVSGGPLTLGLNQYTHSAACCLLDADGEVLFALAKERVTRKKYDGGDVAELMRYAFESTGTGIRDLGLVVANNHLFRIDAFERTLRWAQALNQYRPSYLAAENLLPGVEKREIGHHLAHAWSVLPVAPFDSGLIVVMDGIGSTWEDLHRTGPAYRGDAPPASDRVQIPEHPERSQGWREGESVYRFQGLRLENLFKRWIRQRSPAFLYNYGFENMESLGAVYSRISSHVFGDWNACGKIMGLAPWSAVWNRERPAPPGQWITRGPLEELEVNWDFLHALPHPNQWEREENHPDYARLAALVQRDLEDAVLDFLTRLRERSGETRLCLVGGVALNSSLNGRIRRECGYDEVFVPPYPGDDGLAFGCAHFGLHHRHAKRPPRRRPHPVFLGRAATPTQIHEALERFRPWIRAASCSDPATAAAEALAAGRIVGWFQGRSEFGPRALGARSILADPRDAGVVDRLNRAVKGREPFRPFAPTVLAEAADDVFTDPAPNPYMSATSPVRGTVAKTIPAVVHVDGTSRFQTLAPDFHPRFRALVETFHQRTGIPLVLNTSFNRAGEALVETPADALEVLLDSGLDLLFLEDQRIEKAPFPSPEELGPLLPLHRASATAEVLSDAEGEPLQVRLLGGGRSFDASLLHLGLLEASDGSTPVDRILDELAEEDQLPREEGLSAFEELWRWRLLAFFPAPEDGLPLDIPPSLA